MAKKTKRFVVTAKKMTLNTVKRLIVDTETGVNYLYYGEGYGGGLTALLDKDGKPIVTPVKQKTE